MISTSSRIRPTVKSLNSLLLGSIIVAGIAIHAVFGQERTPVVDGEATGRIVIEAHSELPKPPDFYSATAVSTAHIRADHIEHTIQLAAKIVQGDAKTLSFGLHGQGQVVDVAGEHVQAWAVKQEGATRYLEVHPKGRVQELEATITIRADVADLPATVELPHLAVGKAVGFSAIVMLEYEPGMSGAVVAAEGFAPIGGEEKPNKFQSSTGGKLLLSLNRDGVAAAAIDLSDTTLLGEVDASGKSVAFQLRATAHVTEPGATITILSGNAAVSDVPSSEAYRLLLKTKQEQPVYELTFPAAGTFPVTLDFVASVTGPQANWQGMDFTIAASAIVPITLTGLEEDLEFQSDPHSVVPIRDNNEWVGFLPASGRARLMWKGARATGEGKLFFTTTARVEAAIGAGLLRQQHEIEYRVLQGEIATIRLQLDGPGEILDVQGQNIVSWKVSGEGDERVLDVSLSQPMSAATKFIVRSQTPLDAFPVRVEGLRLTPSGSIRHSGFLRLTNSGAVRLEPTALQGLTQLAPEQYPGEASSARQVFVYRFPSADYEFTVVADRIQPEVNVAQLLQYELAEADRSIRADIELDIREAPIREWNIVVPADYSVVSVTGAGVADYIVATDANEGQRNLKVVFAQEISGRQLVAIHLETNEPTTAGTWTLPHLEFPDANTVRGDIGVIGAPGFRVGVESTNLLVETPLSYFPKPSPNLQQSFRIRELGWSATMAIEQLDRSIQADIFHLYSLSQEAIYGSALINYFVTGAPVSEWQIRVPQALGNVAVDGQDIRNWRQEGDTLTATLHQPVMGAYTLLVTFEVQPDAAKGVFSPGQVEPLQVNSERGYVQVVSPMQVEMTTVNASDSLLKLEALELPAEFRLLSAAPPLGTWQYTQRPFQLNLQVQRFEPGTTVPQVVEYSEAHSRVSQDGELVTDVLYYVKSRGQRALQIRLPAEPVRLWEASVNGQPVTARQNDDTTLIPLPDNADLNVPVEVRLRLGKPRVSGSHPNLVLPVVNAPVLKTQWNIVGDEKRVLIPLHGTITPPNPIPRPTGFNWLAKRALGPFVATVILALIGAALTRKKPAWRSLGLVILMASVAIACFSAIEAYARIGAPSPLQLSLPVLAAGETIELQVRNTPLWLANVSWFGVALCVLGALGVIASYFQRKDWLRASNAEPAPASQEAHGTHATIDDAVKESDPPSHSADVQQRTYSLDWRGNDALVRVVGLLLIAMGTLLQRDGAAIFFGLLAVGIIGFIFLSPALAFVRQVLQERREAAAKRHADQQRNRDTKAPGGGSRNTEGDEPGTSGAVITTMLLIALGLWSHACPASAAMPAGFRAADSITQEWHIERDDSRLTSKGAIAVTGTPGDRFLLLQAPAVLTRFDGDGLRLAKTDIPGLGLAYVISILPAAEVDQDAHANSVPDDQPASEGERSTTATSIKTATYTATFEYQLEAIAPINGVSVPTGLAAVQRIDVRYDEPGWEVTCSNAVRIDTIASDEQATRAEVLLGVGDAIVTLSPKSRDVTTEQMKFFVEGSDLYRPGPGVVDGRHRLNIRTSQGQVSRLTVQVPQGLTVSSVDGPIGSWQFDADDGQLQLTIEPAQSSTFAIAIETQRGLSPFPVDMKLEPLTVSDASGQVGLLAIAFGGDAQPGNADTTTMSAVNLGDFDASMLSNAETTLHRVYRYGAQGGELTLQVLPVEPEVRVNSKQVLSFGDERIVLGVNFETLISRAGVFQLSFPLPAGLEVETLTGAALHHWSELTEDGQRQIVMHLNGKTIGPQGFSLTLSGPTPTNVDTWQIPRFELNDSMRQTGELIVRPTTGIRLRTVSRENVSEADPRVLGGQAQGALAFRLLQRNWDLQLGVEKLEPWVTGQILQDVTLREGQTRTALIASFQVENASIRSLQVVLPITNPEEIRTLRAVGNEVSDLVRTAPDSNIWELQFKRRVIGNVAFRIEYERRGDREEAGETCSPAGFPQARQIAYYLALRTSGRLEIDGESATDGWQPVDWNTIPKPLQGGIHGRAASRTLRASGPAQPLTIQVARHSVAEALKLRVAQGTFTTILSPNGDQLTAVDVTMDVIQRSSLSVGLPPNGELLSIFVNGESVNSVHKGGQQDVWQFYILPGIDDRTANVRFVYSVKGDRLSRLTLVSALLNVPLENIEWNVVTPKGFQLIDHGGDLELAGQTLAVDYDRDSYLSKVNVKRQQQAQQAADLLEQANQLLQAGEQTKARRALNSVANRYALDAASNEDARVQLENLQTQQAIVGLNTRRQRLYLDNDATNANVVDNKQMLEAAADNPILQQDELNFRPQQLSQLLRGNTNEDNQVLQQIAGRLVQHQRTAEPAPQALVISLPEEGSVYTFTRGVQVAENAPLELDLRLRSGYAVEYWRALLLLAVLAAIVSVFATGRQPTPSPQTT